MFMMQSEIVVLVILDLVLLVVVGVGPARIQQRFRAGFGFRGCRSGSG